MTKWNPFLQQFGLAFSDIGTGVADASVTSPHSIFAGVDHLYGANGTAVIDFDPASSLNKVLVRNNGLGLFAVWGVEKPVLKIRVSQVEICWNTDSNVVYAVEYRSAVTANAWLPLSTNSVLGDGGIMCVYDPVNVAEPQRFYRAVAVP